MAQTQQRILNGVVKDPDGAPIFPANVVVNNNKGTTTNQEGYYELLLSANKNLHIQVSFIGYQSFDTTLTVSSKEFTLNITLQESIQAVEEVNVISDMNERNNLISLDLKNIENIPQTTGNIEDVIKTLPGVSSNTELSAQYSVRGGNYDENLIYVNDIEIYRPFLVQSGQQEGLSFVNPDMISSLQFSAGGFNAEYGDKMSSVLDIKYKRPSAFQGKVSASFLGANVLLGGASKNNKFTNISSFRYKTSQYLLNSLETSGDYIPNFYDLQTFFTYDVTPKLEFSVLGNISLNDYNFIPKTRDVKFGTIRNAFNLKIYYEGQELDRFFTGLGAFTASYSPSDKVNIKLITSYFSTAEEITYDLLGQYSISLLDNTIGSESAGDSVANIGVGSFLEHARNYLYAEVYNAELRTTIHTSNTANWKFGLKVQREFIDDQIEEWEYIDSAGYSSPYSDEVARLYSSVYAENTLSSNRFNGFAQYSGKIPDLANHSVLLTAGLRGSYWDVNKQFTLSPRLNIFIDPLGTDRVNYHLATGIYYQPPFYKELRDVDGELHKNLKAQVSYQYVAGLDYFFELWDRPFKFTTEAYYKYMPRLTVYKVDNVSIQYLPEYRAQGYTVGIDFKVNGEFLPGTESWASLSFLEAREDIYQDKYITSEFKLENPGYYPRPTDQLFNFSMYFQDYFPANPDYKVHLTMHYGAKLPTNPPNYNNPSITFKLPPYRRIDMGIAKKLTKRNSGQPLIRGFENIWISAEVFNLFGFENTISYQWIRTIKNEEGISNTFAVPNHLTSRRINFKLQATF
jgi:hypothetical protein